MKLIRTLDVRNALGEGLLWDGTHLLWTDIQARRIYRMDWQTERVEWVETPQRLCSFGLTQTPGRYIAAFDRGLAFYAWGDAEVDLIPIPFANPRARLNDGRVSPDGRFWVGGMVEGSGLPRPKPWERLYSFDGALRTHLDGIQISNSIAFSPEGDRLYFTDTLSGEIDVFDYDDGQITNRRFFARAPVAIGPDGSCVDAEGGVWNARWDGSGQGGKVVRYDSDGTEDILVDAPAGQLTCPCFAGPELNYLCVTSARENLNDPQAHDGAVFIYETSYTGLPAPIFQESKS